MGRFCSAAAVGTVFQMVPGPWKPMWVALEPKMDSAFNSDTQHGNRLGPHSIAKADTQQQHHQHKIRGHEHAIRIATTHENRCTLECYFWLCSSHAYFGSGNGLVVVVRLEVGHDGGGWRERWHSIAPRITVTRHMAAKATPRPITPPRQYWYGFSSSGRSTSMLV